MTPQNAAYPISPSAMGRRGMAALGWPIVSGLVVAGLLTGCSAPALERDGVGNGDSSQNPVDDTGPASVDASGNACTAQRGAGVLRRLTKAEYQSSLAMLFESDDVPSDEPLSGNNVEGVYSTRAEGLWVKDLTAQALGNHADVIAAWAFESRREVVVGCEEVSDSCASELIRSFGRRAFRQPLNEAQLKRYVDLFLGASSFEDAFTRVVSTMIQSPYFLYRREIGTDDAGFADLNDYELGSALAYFLTSAPPDAQLSASIDAGLLRDPAEWDAQVARLLDSPRAESTLVAFLVEWLELDRVLSRTKTEGGVEVTDSLRASMMEEVRQLVLQIYREGGGVSALLDHDSVFINSELAAHYGMAAGASDGFEQVPEGDRAGGLLGTGAFLLGHSTVDSSSPTARGIFVRQQLLCGEVPPPPPALDTDLPVVEGPMTTRERFSVHLSQAVCATCHNQIDPYGFAFESYDGLGRYREEEAGLPVDSSGTTVGLDAGELPFSNAHELTAILSEDQQVQQCFHKNLLEYVSGQADWDNLCSVNLLSSDGPQSASIKDALRSVLSLPHFESRVSQGAL